MHHVRYHKIDLSCTLASQLEKKLLVEFPVFLVLLQEEAKQYLLVGEESNTG